MPSMSSPPSAHNPPAAAGDLPHHRRTFLEILGVVAASLLVLLPYFHLPLSEGDEGIIATGAERILRGQIPYRDFFSELGPASFYLQAAIFKVGSIDVTALRLTAWCLGGALGGLVYGLARKVMPCARARLAVAVFSLICYPSAYRVSHHWWANLFLLLTTLSLVASFSEEGKINPGGQRRWLLLAGLLAGLMLLAMQSKGFWTIAMGAAFLAVEPGLGNSENRGIALNMGLKQAGWFLAGAVSMVGLVGAYLAAQGALGAWIDANVVFLFTNYRSYLDVPQASALRTLLHIGTLALSQPSVHLSFYFLGYFFFCFVAPTIAFAGTAWQLRPARRPPVPEARLLFLLLLVGAGGFLSELHSPDFPHLMWGTPLMLVLLVYQWGAMASRASALRRPAQAAAVVAVVLMVFTAGRKAVNTLRIDREIETRRGTIYVRPPVAGETEAIVKAIEGRVPAGDETFFYPYMAELYFLTATRNPTRFDVLLPDFHSAGQINEAMARLQSARPQFIFSFDKIQRWTIRPHFPDDPPDVLIAHPVERTLRVPGSGYHQVAMISEMEVWAAER